MSVCKCERGGVGNSWVSPSTNASYNKACARKKERGEKLNGYLKTRGKKKSMKTKKKKKRTTLQDSDK